MTQPANAKTPCVICRGGTVVAGTATVTLQRGESVIVIRDVPAEVCSTCGEDYLDDAVFARVYQLAEEALHRGAVVGVSRYVA